MKITRRTKIVSETEKKYSYAIQKRSLHFFCPTCGERREMLSINEATARISANWRDVVRRVENELIHSVETENGAIYICAASLGEV